MCFTSASKSFSLCFKEQALLSAWIKSLLRPCFGTVTVQAAGSELPSQVKTVSVIVRVVVDWRGKERYMKGSNVTDTLLHTGQTRVDLYWPCQMATGLCISSRAILMLHTYQFYECKQRKIKLNTYRWWKTITSRTWGINGNYRNLISSNVKELDTRCVFQNNS